MKLYTQVLPIPYKDALSYYKLVEKDRPSFIFESTDNSDNSSRLSLIGIDPILELVGEESLCKVNCLEERGEIFFDFLRKEFASSVKSMGEKHMDLEIFKEEFRGEENERFKRKNIAQIIKRLIAEFHSNEKNFFGLYGALAYNFVYLYEDIQKTKKADTPDFHLFLFDNILFFNHLTQQAFIYSNRFNEYEAKANADQLRNFLLSSPEIIFERPTISNPKFFPDKETFKDQVSQARELCLKGELMEVVLCRQLTTDVEGDTLPIYENYRAINPSPYMFHFNFGEDNVLLGMSPEVMVRYENDRVILRPISGSIARGKTVIEDHDNMLELLNNPKEKSELDMLIDLGRNDLAKVCGSNVKIDQYRMIEKYSHVMHTVAQVSGKLEADKTGLDALAACLNAGTLTGAPKHRAMQEIENMEKHARGFYGGCIGYLLFNGEVNTGIVIRSAQINKGKLKYSSGATLLYESDPEKELIETEFKAAAFLKNLEKFRKVLV